MSRTIKSVLFAILFCTGFISCEKEYSIEGGNGTGPVGSGSAVFTFDGAPGACTLPVINGTYQVGTAMGVGNNIILTVNVITPGTYTISTGSVNGVTFSASSSFAQAGSAIIQLAASGTPTAAGPFSYTPGANGCAFSITFAGTSGGGGSTGTANYTCTSIKANGIYTQNSTLGSSNTLVLQVNVTTAGTYSITNGPNDGFTFKGRGTLALGAQTITLAGSGIPKQPGIASFSFGSGTTDCSVDINVIAASGGSGTMFIKCKINGVDYEFNKLISTVNHPQDLEIFGGLSSGTALEGFSISFGSETGPLTPNTDYKNELTGGHVDKYTVGVYLSTDAFISNRTLSNTFTSHLTTYTSTGATGTFSGKLYNNNGDGPAIKIITEGSFSVTF